MVANKRECLSCFENMHQYHRKNECRAYNAQVAWNKKMRAILKRDGVIPVPKPPDYSVHTDWIAKVSGSHKVNTWQRTVWALLHKEV